MGPANTGIALANNNVLPGESSAQTWVRACIDSWFDRSRHLRQRRLSHRAALGRHCDTRIAFHPPHRAGANVSTISGTFTRSHSRCRRIDVRWPVAQHCRIGSCVAWSYSTERYTRSAPFQPLVGKLAAPLGQLVSEHNENSACCRAYVPSTHAQSCRSRRRTGDRALAGCRQHARRQGS